MAATLMNLKVLLPFQIFAEKTGVFPHCRGVAPKARWTSATPPGLRGGARTGNSDLRNKSRGEAYVAVDEGVLVKTGSDVLVSVRNAIAGTNLGQLR